MITEKHFSLSHTAFWHQLLPMTESYIRECNVEAARFADHFESQAPAGKRGVINEISFRLFAATLSAGQPVSQIPPSQVHECVEQGLRHISQMRQVHRTPVAPPDATDLAEARELADRLQGFFTLAKLPALRVFPPFPGCGWLSECCGDAFSPRVLVEVKAGERTFRGSDIRQLLCYCALNFASKSYDITSICLVNPRSGRYISAPLEEVVQRLAGRPAVEVLAEVVEYVSEPQGQYLGT